MKKDRPKQIDSASIVKHLNQTIDIICFRVISGKLSWLTSRSLSELGRAHVSPPTTKDKLRAERRGV